MPKLPSLDELHGEIAVLRKRLALPSDDQAFVLWYCSVALTGDDTKAGSCLVGGAGDINADAVYIDDAAQMVFLVQAKYRKSENASEGRTDLQALRDLGLDLNSTDKEAKEFLARAFKNAAPFVVKRLEEARERLIRRGYFLSMRFVTTGRVSAGLMSEFQWSSSEAEFIVQDGMKVRRIFRDYLDGAAPPVAAVDLALDGRNAMHWRDKTNGIDSWVVSVSGSEIAKLFRRSGPRVFARNIRGFLGSTEINKGMRDTLKSEPEKFWYYNNGITIVCDGAKRSEEGGSDVLRLENPQIINGQQTTRVLAEKPIREASVLLRITAFPRDTASGEETFGEMVEQIVAATNRQNPISAADLRSNDGEQVRIEREFLKRGYLYLRKRQARSQAKANVPNKVWWTVTKEQMAQAAAASLLDPYEVRLGRENLFGTDNYPVLFGTHPISMYLMWFWLRRVVRKQSTGRPERAYSVWLVFHVLWHDIAARFPSAKQRLGLVDFLEREWGGKKARPVSGAIECLFKSIRHFYHRRRGVGEEAKDASTFFRAKGLHREFLKFWERPANEFRKKYVYDLGRFAETVEAYEVE